MRSTRRQATLFLSGNRVIEDIRQRFNREQTRIIEPHVTLCREDEVADWDKLGQLIGKGVQKSVRLDFGMPEREGDLVWLSCKDTSEFDRLRSDILGASARKHSPHITLIHPRNGSCSDEIFDEILELSSPFIHTFNEIAFIEQINGGVWKTTETFELTQKM